MGGVTSSVAAKMAFFPPTPPSYALVEDAGAGVTTLSGQPHRENVELLRFRTRKGNTLAAMYVRHPDAASTVLYSHGNAADLGHLYQLFLHLSFNLRVNILGYDYSGYGQSSGKPSEHNTYADIEAAYKCLIENFGAKEEEIILYGQSVGSGPTVDLASRLPQLRAVVLHSPILSGLRVMYPVKRTYWFDIYKVCCHLLIASFNIELSYPLRSCSPSSWSAAGAAVAARASANPPPPRPSSPPSRPSRRVMDAAAGVGRHRVRIAVVGDVHNDWALEEDSKALQFLQPDLVLFTGDYGNENVELVKSISDLQLPKAAILGNHDCWHTHQFSEKKADRVRLQLASLGEQHVGYKCLDFPSIKLSVVGGRPFSCGGGRLFRPKLLSKCYDVNDMAGSAKKIYDAAAGAPEGHSVVLLAHNGPTGLGSRMDDICGRDWVPGGGDHGDPDLERAISDLQRETRVCIPLVVFGHMHKSLAYRRGLRKMIAFGANHTIYLNGAVVPRVKFSQTIPRYEQNQPEGSGSIAPTLRAFTIADLSEGRVEKISEVWVLVSGARTEVEEEIVLYKHPQEHM